MSNNKQIIKTGLLLAKKSISKGAIESQMRSLSTKDFVILDTETTGLGGQAEAVEIAAVKVKNYDICDEFHKYVRPTIRITKSASDIHGITNEFAEKHGEEAIKVYQELHDFVEGLPIVGHNIFFDQRVVNYHQRLAGFTSPQYNVAYDTLKVSRALLDMKSHKLEVVIDLFNLRGDLGSHNAMDDVKATYKYALLLHVICKLLLKNRFGWDKH